MRGSLLAGWRSEGFKEERATPDFGLQGNSMHHTVSSQAAGGELLGKTLLTTKYARVSGETREEEIGSSPGFKPGIRRGELTAIEEHLPDPVTPFARL